MLTSYRGKIPRYDVSDDAAAKFVVKEESETEDGGCVLGFLEVETQTRNWLGNTVIDLVQEDNFLHSLVLK